MYILSIHILQMEYRAKETGLSLSNDIKTYDRKEKKKMEIDKKLESRHTTNFNNTLRLTTEASTIDDEKRAYLTERNEHTENIDLDEFLSNAGKK